MEPLGCGDAVVCMRHGGEGGLCVSMSPTRQAPFDRWTSAAFAVVASTHLYAGLYLKNVKIR